MLDLTLFLSLLLLRPLPDQPLCLLLSNLSVTFIRSDEHVAFNAFHCPLLNLVDFLIMLNLLLHPGHPLKQLIIFKGNELSLLKR